MLMMEQYSAYLSLIHIWLSNHNDGRADLPDRSVAIWSEGDHCDIQIISKAIKPRMIRSVFNNISISQFIIRINWHWKDQRSL